MKLFHRIFSIILIAGMMIGWTTSGSMLASVSQPAKSQADASSKFESLALQQLTSGKADFFVTITEQADLSKADKLQTKEEKGQYVFETLVATADRTQADLRAYLDSQGIEYTTFYIVNSILIKAGTLDLAMAIAGRKDVSQISANHPYQLDQPIIDPKAPNSPTGIENNINFIKAPQVWALGYNGQGTVLAGNDTGLYWNHPALVHQYRGCLNANCSSVDHNYNWWDATGTYPNVPNDGHGHGTHTSGTMVGDDGGLNQIGMAPGARLVHCKNMTDSGSGNDSTFLTCFQWDLAPWDLTHSNPRPDLAPDAINNSWGYWGGGANQFRTAINNLQAAGILVEVSAGNEGPECGTLRSPGDYQEVLTTGSVDHLGQTFPGIITNNSIWSPSRGPSSLDGNYFPDIMAPGEDIRSSVSGGGYEGGWSGTSMAGPHATALVGLIWSANPGLRGQVAETMEIIRSTAGPLTGQGGSNCGGDYTMGPNNDWGYGTIDALAAVQMAVAMGGAGKLQGTVTDAATDNPIEGVKITATHEAGYLWDDLTDATGYYSMTVAAGTFTVTATAYAYEQSVIYPVNVITDAVKIQDIELVAAPTHIISGTVTQSGTNEPLHAKISFSGSPVTVWSNIFTGFYQAELPEDDYTMNVSADLHKSQVRNILVDHDQTQNFSLDPLPCILLVDDDQNGPDVQSYYSGALNNLGYSYNVWDVSTQGDPSGTNLTGYSHVVWFTGFPYSGTFNGANEATVGAYLDAGGNFFLSSQDYLWEMDLTPFGQNYLHIQSFTSDIYQTTVTGQNVFSGLGPYSLSYPFTNYSDVVNPDTQAKVAFSGDLGNAALSYDGTNFNSVFLGYPFEAIPGLVDRSAVMGAAVDFFGGCVPPHVSITPSEQTQIGAPGMPVRYDYNVTNEASVEQEVLLSVESSWPTEAPATAGVLAAGASTTVPVTVTIPMIPNVIIGQDTFTLTVAGMVGGIDTATGTTLANVNPDGEVVAPEGKSGIPLEVVSYEFTVTNSGDYTDSFALAVSGVWTATLPGGENTGSMAAEASIPVTVLVTVPEGESNGVVDVTTLTITSDLLPSVTASADVTTTKVDVSINPPSLQKIGEPGMQVSYVYTVTNEGGMEQEILLNVDSLWWPTEAPTTTGVLAVGASATVPVTVTIPNIPTVIIASDIFTLTASGVVGGIDTATGTTLANVNPDVELIAPENQSGLPLEVVSYQFTVTNTGDYTDSFALAVSGLWTATLPGGENTGPLYPGASTTVTVLVTVPADVMDDDFDVTTLKITSLLDLAIWKTAGVTTTAIVPPPMYYMMLPIITR